MERTRRTQNADFRRPDRSKAHSEVSAVQNTGLSPQGQNLMSLQGSTGNRAVAGLIQTQPKVGPVGDAHEQVADRVAAAVGGHSSHAAQVANPSGRAVPAASDVEQGIALAPGGGGPSKAPAQLKGASPAGHDYGAVSVGGSQSGLPPRLRSGIEQLSGTAVDDVKVRRNSSKPAQLNAAAYTQGSEIHVGPGQERHLAHEAWHVVQQKQGRVRATMQMKGKGINNSKGLEREADVMGRRASSLGDRGSLSHTSGYSTSSRQAAEQAQETVTPTRNRDAPASSVIQRAPCAHCGVDHGSEPCPAGSVAGAKSYLDRSEGVGNAKTRAHARAEHGAKSKSYLESRNKPSATSFLSGYDQDKALAATASGQAFRDQMSAAKGLGTRKTAVGRGIPVPMDNKPRATAEGTAWRPTQPIARVAKKTDSGFEHFNQKVTHVGLNLTKNHPTQDKMKKGREDVRVGTFFPQVNESAKLPQPLPPRPGDRPTAAKRITAEAPKAPNRLPLPPANAKDQLNPGTTTRTPDETWWKEQTEAGSTDSVRRMTSRRQMDRGRARRDDARGWAEEA